MIEYEQNQDFSQAVYEMLADKTITEFNPLREYEVKVFALLCIRTDKDGEHVEGTGAPVVCKKISPPFQVLTKGHYLIIGEYYFWTHANEIAQKAALHRALMQIEVEKDDEKKTLKFKSRKPDIQEFRSTVARFGAWNESLLDFREAFKISAKAFAESQKPKG
jgi:hypothetical protein